MIDNNTYTTPDIIVYDIELESSLLQGSQIDNPGLGGPGSVPWE